MLGDSPGCMVRKLAVCLLTVASVVAAQDKPRLGVGGKVSTLGLGVEAATAVTEHSNVRAGFNGFSYDRAATQHGIRYDGTLRLRSFEAHYDQYLGSLFHISPGVLIYNGNRAEAVASVPGGTSFSLAGTRYTSTLADPVTGTGTLEVRKVAPLVLAGFGNLLPRRSGHFAWNFEFGVVFQGTPDVQLRLNGSGLGALPAFQSSVQAEQARIVSDTSGYVRFYPVVSLGFGYKFGR